MSKYQELFYPESLFGGFTNIDGTVAFYSRVNALLQPSFVVVDFGCGRGAMHDDPVTFRRSLRCLKGKAAKVIGVDVDEVARTNSGIDEFRSLAPGGPLPFGDRSVHMIVSDWVVEHLQDPSAFFHEANRVLVAGGYLCIRTTNIHSYIGIASRFIPNRYHGVVVSRVQDRRKEEDVFPTVYRCNTISAMKHLLATNHFRSTVYGHESEPRYLGFAKVAYAIGVVHQRCAPGFLRAAIFAFGQSQVC